MSTAGANTSLQLYPIKTTFTGIQVNSCYQLMSGEQNKFSTTYKDDGSNILDVDKLLERWKTLHDKIQPVENLTQLPEETKLLEILKQQEEMLRYAINFTSPEEYQKLQEEFKALLTKSGLTNKVPLKGGRVAAVQDWEVLSSLKAFKKLITNLNPTALAYKCIQGAAISGVIQYVSEAIDLNLLQNDEKKKAHFFNDYDKIIASIGKGNLATQMALDCFDNLLPSKSASDKAIATVINSAVNATVTITKDLCSQYNKYRETHPSHSWKTAIEHIKYDQSLKLGMKSAFVSLMVGIVTTVLHKDVRDKIINKFSTQGTKEESVKKLTPIFERLGVPQAKDKVIAIWNEFFPKNKIAQGVVKRVGKLGLLSKLDNFTNLKKWVNSLDDVADAGLISKLDNYFTTNPTKLQKLEGVLNAPVLKNQQWDNLESVFDAFKKAESKGVSVGHKKFPAVDDEGSSSFVLKNAKQYQAEASGDAALSLEKAGTSWDNIDDAGKLIDRKYGHGASIFKEVDDGFGGKIIQVINTNRKNSIIEQATRQVNAAGGTPIKWEISTELGAKGIKDLFVKNGINIEVIYVQQVKIIN